MDAMNTPSYTWKKIIRRSKRRNALKHGMHENYPDVLAVISMFDCNILLVELYEIINRDFGKRRSKRLGRLRARSGFEGPGKALIVKVRFQFRPKSAKMAVDDRSPPQVRIKGRFRRTLPAEGSEWTYAYVTIRVRNNRCRAEGASKRAVTDERDRPGTSKQSCSGANSWKNVSRPSTSRQQSSSDDEQEGAVPNQLNLQRFSPSKHSWTKWKYLFSAPDNCPYFIVQLQVKWKRTQSGNIDLLKKIFMENY